MVDNKECFYMQEKHVWVDVTGKSCESNILFTYYSSVSTREKYVSFYGVDILRNFITLFFKTLVFWGSLIFFLIHPIKPEMFLSIQILLFLKKCVG